ncbi:hypothetical protein BESB_023220 [Besnoitia besnoiti]|uniref:Uncharacterized protein n=1 Tax=Besnoitia besnoiti TaxID=94643 RepID=A0A2A9M8W3_BESBE|nr:hypothetical protein BESB_023220 [Besnoitia besnoiti]PFH31830.1 hypothetical protein BESB_023220 [Besnoitia besnoiti]
MHQPPRSLTQAPASVSTCARLSTGVCHGYAPPASVPKSATASSCEIGRSRAWLRHALPPPYSKLSIPEAGIVRAASSPLCVERPRCPRVLQGGWPLFLSVGALRGKHSATFPQGSGLKTKPLALADSKKTRRDASSNRGPMQTAMRQQKEPGLLDELMATVESFLSRETEKINSTASSFLGMQDSNARRRGDDVVLSRFQAAIQPGGWEVGIPTIPFLLLGPVGALVVYACLWRSLWRPLKREEERAARDAASQENLEETRRTPSLRSFPLTLVPLYASDLLSHIGPFLAKHIESRGACEKALSELQDPLLAREARGTSLAALQSMLQYPAIADRLCATSAAAEKSHPQDDPPLRQREAPVAAPLAVANERCPGDADAALEAAEGAEKTALEILLSVFVGQNQPEGIAKQSTEWLVELSCLCTILRHTVPEDREVPYELLLRLVNGNESLWAHEPSFEELRARLLLKLFENEANALSVYDREIPELQARRLAELEQRRAEEKDEETSSSQTTAASEEGDAPPKPLEERGGEGPSELASTSRDEEEAAGAEKTAETSKRDKTPADRPRLVLEYLLNPSPYKLPDSILLQIWPVGKRIRAGEPEHALRKTVKLLSAFVDAREEARARETGSVSAAAEEKSAQSAASSSHTPFWRILLGRESKATTAARAGKETISGDPGCSAAARERTGGQGVHVAHSPEEASLASLGVAASSALSPRRSPPWPAKVLLRELENDLLCVLSVVLVCLFTRKGGGENLFGEMGKIGLTALRAIRGLVLLEGAYHFETKFIHSPEYYASSDSDMIKQSVGLAAVNGLFLGALLRTHKYVLLPFLLLRLRDMVSMDFRI